MNAAGNSGLDEASSEYTEDISNTKDSYFVSQLVRKS